MPVCLVPAQFGFEPVEKNGVTTTSDSKDDRWRDFSKTATEFEARFATEADCCVRLAHAANNDAATCKRFADGQIAPTSAVTTDGYAGYNVASLGKRQDQPVVQTKAKRAENDAVQACHWSNSNLKHWLLATHGGAVSGKYLQAYLDEFTFRHNRRKTKGVARIAAPVIQTLGGHAALAMESLINQTRRCPWFSQPELGC